MFKLVFLRGSLSGRALVFSEPRVVLGRAPQCDVQLDDDGVSRQHCCLQQTDDGLCVVDMGSTNGVRVNGQRITQKRLNPGDRVSIGTVSFVIESVQPLEMSHSPTQGPQTPRRTAVLRKTLIGLLRNTGGAVALGLAIAGAVILLTVFVLPHRKASQADRASGEAATTTTRPAATTPPPPSVAPAPLAPEQYEPETKQAPEPQVEAPAEPAAPGQMRVVTGFEGSYPRRVTRVAEDRFAIDVGAPEANYFLFKLEGVAGKKITIDLVNCGAGLVPSLNPVYSYERPDDPASLVSEQPAEPAPLRRASNGPLLPDTRGQKWHYIGNVRMGLGVISFSETFERNEVFIAMKAPFTYSYSEAFLKTLEGKPGVRVLTIGVSKENRNLRVVQIGEPLDNDGKPRPVVLMYAREHGNEQDASFPAEGAIQFLISDAPEAQTARQRLCFLVIPILDPDGAAQGKYENITDKFFWGDTAPESLAYAAWFKKWMDDGYRLDMAIDLHCERSYPWPHLFSAVMEKRRLAECRAFHQLVRDELKGLDVAEHPYQASYSRFRMGGWLEEYYSALYIAYEVNSQAPSRHLAIWEMREIGAGMVRAALRFLDSPAGVSLLEGNTAAQAERLERWKKYGHLFRKVDAFVAEEKCRQKARSEKTVK